MFNKINYFNAFFIWSLPLFTIVPMIIRRGRWGFMLKYQWGMLFAFSALIAGYTTYTNLKAIDDNLLSRAQEYAGCKLLSRGASDSSPVSRVTLDCGGKTYLVSQQYYDDIMDTANRHTSN